MDYIGLGGEMGYYAKSNKEYFNVTKCFTNSVECFKIDYNKLNLKNYIYRKSVMLINISKRGLTNLQNLIQQINYLIFDQILYIGCSLDTVEKDEKSLRPEYKLERRYVLIFTPNN